MGLAAGLMTLMGGEMEMLIGHLTDCKVMEAVTEQIARAS